MASLRRHRRAGRRVTHVVGAATARVAPTGTWAVVPCFNEAPVVGAVLSDLVAAGFRVVCVDDASCDGSDAAARRVPGVVVLRHPINLGQGAALQTGIDYALTDPAARAIVTFDADGQHDVAEAAGMAARLGSAGPDGRPIEVVLGSRFASGGQAAGVTRGRRWLLRLATRYTRLQTGLAVTDTHNGLRAFTAEAAARLHLTQPGMAHASEILERIAGLHLGWVEQPVTIRYSAYAKDKGQSGLNAVNIVAELLLGRRA
jgi:glycosyltransferase involved in cell wall biosynthesis